MDGYEQRSFFLERRICRDLYGRCGGQERCADKLSTRSRCRPGLGSGGFLCKNRAIGGAVRRRAGRETEKRTSAVAHPKSVDRSGQASAKDRKITHTKAASAAHGAGRQNTRYGLYSSDRPSGPSLRSRCSITVYHINIGFARIFSILLEFYRKTS